MSHNNTKIFFEDGGDELVVAAGGKLTVQEGATVAGLNVSTAAAASASALGGVKAATRTAASDTVECKIDGTSKKLYVPAYPVAANMAAPAADADTDAVRASLIALIGALKAAGLMTADSE